MAAEAEESWNVLLHPDVTSQVNFESKVRERAAQQEKTALKQILLCFPRSLHYRHHSK